MEKPDSSQHSFHLTRYFSLAALFSIVVAALVLGQMYQYFARQHLIQAEERHNIELGKYVSAMIWPTYGTFLTHLQGMTGDAIRRDGRAAALHRMLLQQLHHSRIVKLKIFDTRGLTVYASAPELIGTDQSGRPDFEQARRGTVTSQLSFHDRFFAHADDRPLQDRNLLSSVVPVYGSEGDLQGVMALYNDVTPLIEDIRQTHTQLVLITIAVMLGLYSVLFFIIQRADRIIRDKSDVQRESERQIQHQANHDALTGLPNRRYFHSLLERCMARAEASQHLIAVLFIDLDRFKPINDTLGHPVGDQLLKVIGERLATCCRDSDIVSRIGGDEFTVILDQLDNVLHIERAAQRIIDTIAQPIYLADKELEVGSSIGIAIYPFDDQDIDELIKHADTAMYHAKESGRNCYRFYSEEMNVEALHRMEMERDLRNALRHQQFEIHYQPRFALPGRQVASVEALLRWRHPERGLVPPGEFIPLAEESGLIGAIGHWVLNEACRQIADLAIVGHEALGLSINVSARQFENHNFIRDVSHALKDTDLAPHRLELELTETMLMHSCEECSITLDALKQTGVRLSLDDFGTGYSSLSYLKQLPLDVLKIDRSFICDVTENPRNAALASTIAGLGHKLGMHVVAEGVETDDQLSFVTDCLCHEVQGFLLARPMPLNELQLFLQQQTLPQRSIA